MCGMDVALKSNDTGKTVSRRASYSTKPLPTSPSNTPDLYHASNYRVFLNNFYLHKKSTNPSYSMSVFARKAGLGGNSRGYLKMIIDGKRNLTPHTIRRFADALDLNPQQSLYFENLVYLNQAKTYKDQEYFLSRLGSLNNGKESPVLYLLRHQLNYCTHWYYVAVRELVALKTFKEDPRWIASNLRNKITEEEAKTALQALVDLGFLIRNRNNRLQQSTPIVTWNEDIFNERITQFHSEMIELAKTTLQTDSFEERDASSVTLSCSKKLLPLIYDRVANFRNKITTEFAQEDKEADSVIQINFQVFQITPASTSPHKKGNPYK